MTASVSPPMIAVDIGNSRTKLGLFEATPRGVWPQPIRTLEIASAAETIAAEQIDSWLHDLAQSPAIWRIVSVNRAMSAALMTLIARRWPAHQSQLLTFADLPLRVALPQPGQVGMDRLAAAVAANFLRAARRPAVVVDVGTAMTVDLISADGQFLGGAILPGMRLAAQTLSAACDLLPEIKLVAGDAPPEPVGRSTREAMESGLFWGAVGAMRELAAHYAIRAGAPPQLFLSGGFAPLFAEALGAEAAHVPDLVLGGIVLASRR